MPTDATNGDLDRTELTPLELAEAEAGSDLLDADVEGHGADAPPTAALPRTPVAPPAVGETEIAAAESQSDLSHVDHPQ